MPLKQNKKTNISCDYTSDIQENYFRLAIDWFYYFIKERKSQKLNCSYINNDFALYS